jgi:hypothetical protein
MGETPVLRLLRLALHPAVLLDVVAPVAGYQVLTRQGMSSVGAPTIGLSYAVSPATLVSVSPCWRRPHSDPSHGGRCGVATAPRPKPHPRSAKSPVS